MNTLPTDTEADVSELSDQALLHLFSLHANHSAFAEIVRRYEKLVMSVCLRTTRNSHDAEDAFQATFIALAKRPTQLRKATCLSSWLYGVAWRTSLRAVRRQIKRQSQQIPEDAQSSNSGPFERISKIQEMSVLDEELNKLPEHYRSVLVMNFLTGYSNQQIADQLQASRGVIDGRIQRAKNALRVRLVQRGVKMSVLGTIAITGSGVVSGATPALVQKSIAEGIDLMSGDETTSTIASLARPETIGISLPSIPTAVITVALAIGLTGWFIAQGNTAVAFDEVSLVTAIDVNQETEEDQDTVNISVSINFTLKMTAVTAKEPNTEAASVAKPETPEPHTDAAAEPKKTAEAKRERELLEFDGDWGNVSGQIVFDGPAPQPTMIHVKGAEVKDKQICAAVDLYDLSLQVDNTTLGIENCFVYLVRAPTIHPMLQEVEVKTLLQDQKNCQFVPHCQFVRVGQTVKVVSSDTVAHNIHTYPLRNQGASSIAPAKGAGGGQLLITPTMSELLPFSIGCDFHSWMKGYWLVLDHPYAAQTDSNGRFRIPGLPAGKHTFRIWHERVGYIDRNYEVEVVDGVAVKLPPIAVSATEFER